MDLQIEPHIVLNTNGNTLRSLKHGLIKKKDTGEPSTVTAYIHENRLPIKFKKTFQQRFQDGESHI